MGKRPRRVVWTSRSLQDLRETASYVARDSPRSAARLSDLILETGASLATLSRRGRPFRGVPGEIRQVFVFSYRVVYAVTDDEVWILTVIHGARDLPSDALPDP